jgi:hypothetical protein
MTVDFQDEATYFRLLNDGKAFIEFVLAFLLSFGFQLTHTATCGGGGCLTRHSHYVRVRLGGLTIWRIQCRAATIIGTETNAKPFDACHALTPYRRIPRPVVVVTGSSHLVGA